jgi:hypothetical protein
LASLSSLDIIIIILLGSATMYSFPLFSTKFSVEWLVLGGVVFPCLLHLMFLFCTVLQ